MTSTLSGEPLRAALGAEVDTLRNARLVDGSLVDVDLDPARGVVLELRPAGTKRRAAPTGAPSAGAAHLGARELDLDGRLLLASTIEPHAHIDKAFSWDRITPAYGDLGAAIEAWRAYAATTTEQEILGRARRACTTYLRNGTTGVRTHVDLHLTGDPLRGVSAAVALREELRDVMHLEVVLLCSSLNPTPDILAALDLGVDVMGGCPHLAADPAAETTRLLDLAAPYGLPVDLHTDEQLDPGMLSIRDLAAEVARRGLGGRAAASHCVSLGQLDPAVLAGVLDEVAAAGLGVVSLPITNLYLQARDDTTAARRGITAVRALLDAGVAVAAGGDNVRDPFNPMGRGDAFETTSLLVTAAHLDAASAYAAVSSGARQVLGLAPAGPAAGLRADLVAVRADTLDEAVAGPGDDRIVLYGARVVSVTTVTAATAAGSRAAVPA